MDKQQFECFTLSPLDGRYASIKDALGEYFSEYALVKYRVFVEIQWLKFLIENVESDVLSKFNKDNLGQIEAISKISIMILLKQSKILKLLQDMMLKQ